MKKIFGLFILLFATFSYAEPIQKLVFFGDSLTDNGNLYGHSFGYLPKSPPYYQGRFSNGFTWAEYLADYYQKNYAIPSDNYAVGGATAALRNPFKEFIPFKMEEEVVDYIFRTHNQANEPASTLYFIWIGANDYLIEQTEDPDTLTDEVINALISDIQRLVDRGAKHFIVFDLPDLGKIPNDGGDPTMFARLSALSVLHQQKLTTAIAKYKEQHPEVTISSINIMRLFTDLIEHPEKFNDRFHMHITDTTHTCWNGGYTVRKNQLTMDLQQASLALSQTQLPAFAQYVMHSPSLNEAYRISQLQAAGLTPCEHPENYLFWDHFHPTTVIHQILAEVLIDHLKNQKLP